MTVCPICDRNFEPVGRQLYCSGACRAAAYRARRDGPRPVVALPARARRRPLTVYQCDSCGGRELGGQYCDVCHSFMRKVGVGGDCPHCDLPVAVQELGHEVAGK